MKFFFTQNIFSVLLLLVSSSQGCEDELFEGFGIYLGSVRHFSRSQNGTVKRVVEQIYSDLGIRLFRTSYEEYFSPRPNEYLIPSNTPGNLSWIEIHHAISKYSDIKVLASVWSPPHYMKNATMVTLLPKNELAYYYFIRNVTQLMKDEFKITVEKVSPVNEPENFVAPWDHTNMAPDQLCRMVKEFNDSLISVCPENSYFWVSELYSNVGNNTGAITCSEACEIFGSHSYALNIDLGTQNNFKAYYDLVAYERGTKKPIWQTEVSSTYGDSEETQMQEAIDLSINVANFVGYTCVQRYYFWYSYTLGSSGESLIWGKDDGSLTLPKKYFAYKHFTKASEGGPKKVTACNPHTQEGMFCVQFGEEWGVFVNNLELAVNLNWFEAPNCKLGTVRCTTDFDDWTFNITISNDINILPPKSVCSCEVKPTDPSPSSSSQSIKLTSFLMILISSGFVTILYKAHSLMDPILKIII